MSTQTNSNNAVRTEVTRSRITVDSISKADYQKEGTLTAQIRQVVNTKSFYPSKKISSNLQDNIFEAKDFGFTEQEFDSQESRVAWLAVPPASKLEEIQALLDKHYANGATIYKILSNEPILTKDQEYSIEGELKTKDDYANRQVVRTPTNEATIADGTANSLLLDNDGNVQYRRTFFYKTPQEDIDLRGQSATYASPEILAELQGASVMQGQTI